jgi:HK97 family phage portal protein
MPSLLGKASRALAVRNAAPPLPMGSKAGMWTPGMMLGDADDVAYMAAYTSNGTVQSNVSLLASSAAKPEWRLYRKERTDGRVRYTTNDQGSDQRTEFVRHQALDVLNRPAVMRQGDQEIVIWTRFQLFELCGIWLETTGKAPLVVERDPRSSIPLGLWPVRPDRLKPVPDNDRYLQGWMYTAPDGRTQIPLEPDEVIINRYPDPLDPYGGCGPIRSVLTDIDSVRYASEWNRQYFVNSAEPGGVIEVDHEIDDDEWHDLMERWREGHRGVARAHRIAVLEAGQRWVPNMHTLRDMDFVALRNVSRDIIRESLGMHKVMTGVTDDVNRANAQTGEEVFASWKVSPRLDRWKDVLNFQFLPLFGSAGENVEFDYVFPMPLNREQDNAELTAKSTAALALIQAGYDPAAVAEVVGLPDMPVVAPPVPAGATGTSGTNEPDDPNAGEGNPEDPNARLRQMAVYNLAGGRR